MVNSLNYSQQQYQNSSPFLASSDNLKQFSTSSTNLTPISFSSNLNTTASSSTTTQTPIPLITNDKKAQYSQILSNYFDSIAGISGEGDKSDISIDDLKKIANGNYAPDVKNVATALIQNPNTLKQFTDKDSKITKKSLADTQMTPQKALSVLKDFLDPPKEGSSNGLFKNIGHFFEGIGKGIAKFFAGSNGHSPHGINKETLEQLANGDDPELKAAANVLLYNTALFDETDTASKGGEQDGIINAKDLSAEIEKLNPSTSESSKASE